MTRKASLGSITPVLLVAAVLFLTGIRWGLPGRSVDPFLFGDHPVWSGAQILALAGDENQDNERAADVSSKPLNRSAGAVRVNADDQDRARIVRRYRLMSHQPDEFATFAALSRMKPGQGDFDPRMYKYGGLWIYPVGALLKAASFVHWVKLRPDAAYYLDHPDAFGWFYVIARLYSVVWGLIATAVVVLLVRRICASDLAAACGAVCFALMPVVVNAAHEAKPHLAATALILLAVLAGSYFAERGGPRLALLTAILCGAAISMAPSALPVILILPVMMLLRRRLPGAAYGFASLTMWTAITAAVYFLTNPYVLIHLLGDRAVLRSNVGNSSAFYHLDWAGAGVPRALLLVGLGMSLILGAVGIIGAAALGVRAGMTRDSTPRELRRKTTGLLLAAPTLAIGVLFVVFAAKQSADYARFALPLDAFLAIEAVVAVATFIRSAPARGFCFVVLILSTGAAGIPYVHGFVHDCSSHTTRIVAAQRIAASIESSEQTLATRDEPAPWSLPPVDLFRWRIVVPPVNWPEDRSFPGARWTVGPRQSLRGNGWESWFGSTPISWADKPFEMQSEPLAGTRAGYRPAR